MGRWLEASPRPRPPLLVRCSLGCAGHFPGPSFTLSRVLSAICLLLPSLHSGAGPVWRVPLGSDNRLWVFWVPCCFSAAQVACPVKARQWAQLCPSGPRRGSSSLSSLCLLLSHFRTEPPPPPGLGTRARPLPLPASEPALLGTLPCVSQPPPLTSALGTAGFMLIISKFLWQELCLLHPSHVTSLGK